MKDYYCKLCMLVLFFLCCSHSCIGINFLPDSTIARLYHEQASYCAKTEHLDSALFYANRAMQLYEKSENWGGWVDAVNERGKYLWKLGRRDEGAPLLDSALQTSRLIFGERSLRTANCYLAIGMWGGTGTIHADSLEKILFRGLYIKEEILGPNHKEIVEAWRLLFVYFSNDFSFDNELYAAKKELETLKRLNLPESTELAIGYHDLGYAFMHKSEHDSAEIYFKKALDFFGKSDLGGQDLEGDVYFYLGYMLDSDSLIKKSLEIYRDLYGDYHIRSAMALQALSVRAFGQGNYKSSIEYARRLNEINQVIYPPNDHRTAVGYSYFSLILANHGRLESALINAQKARSQMLMSEMDNHPAMAEILRNLSEVWGLIGEGDSTLKYAIQSQELTETLYGPNHYSTISGSSALGLAHFRNENYNEAWDIFQKFVEFDFLSPRKKWDGYYHSALIQFQLNNFDYGWKLLELAESLLDEYPQLFISEKLYIHDLRAEQLKISKRFPESLEEYRAAISYYLSAYNNQKERELHSKELPYKFLLLLNEHAKLCMFLYFRDNDERYLRMARESVQNATLFLGKIRNSLSKEEWNLISGDGYSLFELGIQIELLSGSPISIHGAFKMAEKSKAILLREGISRSLLQDEWDIPMHLSDREVEIESQLAAVRFQVAFPYDQASASVSNENLIENQFCLLQERDSLRKELKNNYPGYFKARHSSEVIELSNLQHQLPDSSCLIEYFYGDSNIYMFAVTRDTCFVDYFPNDSTFIEWLEAFQGQLKFPELNLKDQECEHTRFQDFFHLSYQIGKRLIPSAINQIKPSINHLILVTDGPLNQLPFDILITEKPQLSRDEVDYSKLPFLLKSHRISYAWSATVLMQGYREIDTLSQMPALGNEFLVFAPSYESWPQEGSTRGYYSVLDSFDDILKKRMIICRGGIPSPLPFARLEAEMIAREFKSKVILDTTATERTFHDLAPQAKYIHIPAHGFISSKDPESSNVAFLPSVCDSNICDGFLQVGEIYSMKLTADLIVLTVCNSGNGINQRGEGAQSIARAFRYAGCKNVVASLWEVEDEAGMNVSLNFYENLSQGMTTAEALRQSKLKQLREGGTMRSHPYYWAPMVLVGADIPIYLEKSEKEGDIKSICLLIAGLGLLVLVWTLKYFQK